MCTSDANSMQCNKELESVNRDRKTSARITFVKIERKKFFAIGLVKKKSSKTCKVHLRRQEERAIIVGITDDWFYGPDAHADAERNAAANLGSSSLDVDQHWTTQLV